MIARKSLIRIAALVVGLHGATALAHDPKEHATESAKPDCAALESSGDATMATMDANDPMMQALRKKCMAMDQAGDAQTPQPQSNPNHAGDHHDEEH